MHTRRASHGGVRPLNCGVRRRVIRSAIVCALSVAASSCATTGSDDLCREIVRFANSMDRSQEQSVVLTGRWMEIDEESGELVIEKACKNESPAGQRFCDYLLENTSTEFPGINFSRALSCIAPSVYSYRDGVHVISLFGEVSSSSTPGVRDGVTIVISLTPPEDGKELKISAVYE